MKRNMKYFMISISDDIYSNCLEIFLTRDLQMTLSASGMGSVEFTSPKKPKNLRRRIIHQFGKKTYEYMKFFEFEDNE